MTDVKKVEKALNRYGAGMVIECHGNSFDRYVIEREYFHALYDAARAHLASLQAPTLSADDVAAIREALRLHRSMAMSGKQPSLRSELEFTNALSILGKVA